METSETNDIATEELRLRLLGTMSLANATGDIPLPKSRKVRALLAYLALAPRESTRTHLCELLWEGPSDPRGELRWCLSRIRSVLEADEQTRVHTRGDLVELLPEKLRIDVVELSRTLDRGIASLDLPELRAVARAFKGEFLEGLNVDDSPLFSQWVSAERRRLRTLQSKVLRELVQRLPADDDEVLVHLEHWLQADPFARDAHERLLTTLVRRGRLREAEEHLAATMRLFELEGLEWLSLREAWRAAKTRARTPDIKIETPAPTAAEVKPTKRASICVLPFIEHVGDTPTRTSLGDGLADDIITRLAKLRALFVIARGTAFSLVDRHVDAQEAGRILKVDYVASGSVRRRSGRVHVLVELTETSDPRIVWSDEFECAEDDALIGLERVGNGIVASIAEEVEAAERKRAVLKAPSSLNAWEAYHRGLWHIHRFNAVDNDRAEHFFRMSAMLDPTFARAHAGLSFAHFQNAFLHRPAERDAQVAQAYETAGQSLMADDRDPAAHWAMGRALWLIGNEHESMTELTTSVDLSPNFALGHYTLGFVQGQSGDPRAAIQAVSQSRSLSPFDPLLFAMLATHALAHARLGNYTEAAAWGAKAAARPNAHQHVIAIAAHCLALDGRIDEAKSLVARIHAAHQHYSMVDFLSGFRLAPDAQTLFRRSGALIGLS